MAATCCWQQILAGRPAARQSGFVNMMSGQVSEEKLVAAAATTWLMETACCIYNCVGHKRAADWFLCRHNMP
jgi:hypothetical protein